jgi:hypothetical protein
MELRVMEITVTVKGEILEIYLVLYKQILTVTPFSRVQFVLISCTLSSIL